MNHFNNKLMIAACVIGFLLQFAVTEIPFPDGGVPEPAHLSLREWLRLGILAVLPLLAYELMILFPL